MTWYQEWFGEEYLDLYAHRDDQEADRHVDFLQAQFDQHPRAVLDLACGAGRHTAALRRRGYRALGLDLSKVLLAEARELPRVNGDMRCLPFDEASFDWVLNFFTSFGYFESDAENDQVLAEMARVISPGGRILMDLFNREHVLSRLVPHERQSVRGQEIEIERWYDPERERINKRIRIQTSPETTRSFLESVRAYRPQEVHAAIDRVGLEMEKTFGGFSGEPFDEDSSRFILIAKRN